MFKVVDNFFKFRKKLFSDSRRGETNERNDDSSHQRYEENIIYFQVILLEHNVSCGQPNNN
jgi:hypothetical protein